MTSTSSCEEDRGRAQQILRPGRSQHRSESLEPDERSSATAVDRNHERGPRALCIGNVVRVFSKSAGSWLDAEVVEFIEDDVLRLEYMVGKSWYSKVMYLHSEDLCNHWTLSDSPCGEVDSCVETLPRTRSLSLSAENGADLKRLCLEDQGCTHAICNSAFLHEPLAGASASPADTGSDFQSASEDLPCLASTSLQTSRPVGLAKRKMKSSRLHGRSAGMTQRIPTCPGALKVGDKVKIQTSSMNEWKDARIQKLLPKSKVCVEVEVNGQRHRKILHAQSHQLSMPPSTGNQQWLVPCEKCKPCCLLPSSEQDVKKHVAEGLAGKGFRLRQVLLFYKHLQDKYGLDGSWTTERVVREVIIPETAEQQCCYMESSFMGKHGGPQRAKKLLSHAIPGCSFLTTVLNVIIDASNFNLDDLEDQEIVQRNCNCDELVYGNVELNVDIALRELSADALESTYWLCILAINEHKMLCGDCWTCRDKYSKPLSVEQLKEEACPECGPKRNPCPCGMPKFHKADPRCEVDKIVDIIRGYAEEVVVSVDPELASLKRLWMLKEIHEAVTSGKAVVFRTALGLAEDVQEKLRQGRAVVPAVAECQTNDPNETKHVLKQIDAVDGGQDSFNALVSSMVEINFGVLHRLPKVGGASGASLQRLRCLEMDGRWAHTFLTSLSELGWTKDFGKLNNLRRLKINFGFCMDLKDVSSLGQVLKELKKLQHLEMFFGGCSALQDVSSIGDGLKQLKNLQHLEMTFGAFIVEKAALADISSIGEGVKELKNLQHLVMNFDGCSELADVSSIGQGLKELKNLQRLVMLFTGCSALADVSSIGRGLKELKKLQDLEMYFSSCSALADVSSIGEGLKELENLQRLKMHFLGCFKLPSKLQKLFISFLSFARALRRCA